jgi:alpha-N-arabinofuranosidase
MDFAELINTDAYVSGNVGSLAPYDMNQWVEYITSGENASLANERRKNGRDKPWNLKFFGIGNETWGCGGNMTPDYAADINARYSTFVNAPKSMGMIKVASGSTGNVSWDHKSFTEAMMKHGGKLDALSFHYYAMPNGRPRGPATGFTEEKWADELDLALKIEGLIAETEQVMDKYDPQKKVALYVDEWGSWYDPEPGSTPGFLYQQNTLRDVQVAALSLNIFHRHTERVKLAAIAQMINVLQAMILTDKEKMILTPTYHVFDMYQPFMEAVPYPARVAGPQYSYAGHSMAMVDVSAARGKDGKLYLALVNSDPHKSARVATNLTGRAKGQILTGPAMDSHNSFDKPDAVKPMPFSAGNGGKLTIDLPSKSLVVVSVE